MAFTRPVVGADISAADFGQPVYDLVTHPPGRQWRYAVSQSMADSTWGLLNGTNVIPGETGMRNWIAMLTFNIDPSQTGIPKDAYMETRINGVTQEQIQIYIDRANASRTVMFSFGPISITAFAIWINQMRVGGGRLVLIDGGP